MSGYLHFIPEFVLCTNSSLFWFRIANELSEFRNYLFVAMKLSAFYAAGSRIMNRKAISCKRKKRVQTRFPYPALSVLIFL